MDTLIGAEPLRAGVEDLLPLLLFVVLWWVSSRREKKRRLERERGPQPQVAAREGQPLPTGDDERVDPLQLIQQMLFGGMELPPLEPPPIPAEPVAVKSASERRAEPPTRPAPPPEWVREARPPARPGTPVQPKMERRSRPLARPSRQELRRAIVWSEVLAPPVALRDEPPRW